LTFYQINHIFADFFGKKTCVLKNLTDIKISGFIEKKPASLTCVEITCVKP
jgi:hypothetical protein